ncbi:MAG: PIN domain-containing protein [Candidatus Bathyarchaeia archaeon]
MAAIKVFLDTDVLINWLAKEVDSVTGQALWRASYQILKRVEAGKLRGFITIVNVMELRFVLRRKKRWSEGEIASAIKKIQQIPNLTVLVPTEADMIAAYNLQGRLPLGPFDALYYAIARATADFLISRDQALLTTINRAERKEIALTPEGFLGKIS